MVLFYNQLDDKYNISCTVAGVVVVDVAPVIIANIVCIIIVIIININIIRDTAATVAPPRVTTASS